MNNTIKNIIIIIITIVFLISIFFVSLKYIDSKNNKVDDNYTIVFRGESIDKLYSTYVYKTVKTKKEKKKKKVVITYKYINTVRYKNNNDYTYSLEKVTKKGKTNDINKILDIVKENNATSYAEIKSDNSIINIDEYSEYLL